MNLTNSIHCILLYTLSEIMPPVVNNTFMNWLKANVNIKLTSDAAVLRISHEGVTDFPSLVDFDRDSIEFVGKVCNRKIDKITEDIPNGIPVENVVAGANISFISIRRLVVAMGASKYYKAIGRTATIDNMHYFNILKAFKEDHEAYVLLKKQDEPKYPAVNDKDKEKKIIK